MFGESSNRALMSLLPPTPGQVLAGAGNAIQAIENAVGDAIGGVIGAVTGRTPDGKRDLTIQLPDGRGGRITMPEGVITTDQFREFAQAVGQAFQAVRQDVTRIKTLTAANAARGGLYGPLEEDGSMGGGGGGGGMDPMMLLLLLRDRDGQGTGGSSSPPMDTTTLLLLMMSKGGLAGGGGGSRMDPLMLLLALGKI